MSLLITISRAFFIFRLQYTSMGLLLATQAIHFLAGQNDLKDRTLFRQESLLIFGVEILLDEVKSEKANFNLLAQVRSEDQPS